MLRFEGLTEGALFAGRYRIEARIGHGGTGEVFRARDELADQVVALKVLFPGTGGVTLERLRRELRLVRKLRHPGILRIHDLGEAEGLLYLVTEFLPGESLRARLDRVGPLSPKEARRILAGLLGALAAAHDAGLVHRDVKPGNVFLVPRPGGGEQVVLLDFGLAREVEGRHLTTVGRFVGTPAYSAPEQVRGERDVGPAADLYAAGITAWEMLAGRPPFEALADVDVLAAHLEGSLPSPRRALAGTPVVLRALVLRLLERDPARRPTARRALAILESGGLRSALAARGFLAARLGRRARAGLAGVLAALLVLGVAAGWALTPTSVRVEDGRILVRLRAGGEVSRGATEKPAAAVALGAGVGPFRRLWVVEGPDGTAEENRSRDVPGILSARPWFAPFRLRSRPGGSLPWKWIPWPDVGGRYRKVRAWSLEGVRRAEEPLLVVAGNHSPSYPSWVVLLAPDGELLGPWFHPGHVETVLPYRAAGGDLRLGIVAYGNLLGPRPVVYGLPASFHVRGQAPPWTAPLASVGPAPGWVTFLPFGPLVHDLRLAARGGGLEVEAPGMAPAALDPATGVPLAPDGRGGLSPEEWKERRRHLLSLLEEEAGLVQTGRPAEGAVLLDRFAREVDGPPEMVAVAALRAAVAHLRSAEFRGRIALESALSAVDRALAAEPALPRARLLREELLLRLGRTAEVARLLRDWGRGGEEAMYAYEHLLLDRLAGTPVPPERFLRPWRSPGPGNPWMRLVAQVIARDREDWSAAERLASGIPRSWKSGWNLHHWWAARAFLDRPDPDPAAALRHLSREALEGDAGMTLPVSTTRLLATVLATGASPPSLLDAAEAECSRLARRATFDLHALAMLPWAREDLERARRLLEGRSVRAPGPGSPRESPRRSPRP